MKPLQYQQILVQIGERLQAMDIAFCFLGEAALFIQDVEIQALNHMEVTVQWDVFNTVYNGFTDMRPGTVSRDIRGAAFAFDIHDIHVTVSCRFNTVVSADVDRIAVSRDGIVFWAKSVNSFLRDAHTSNDLMTAIQRYMENKQHAQKEANAAAWNQNSYDAWVTRFGPPRDAVSRILKDPNARLMALQPFLGDVYGKKVMNLMGSHGMKAVACAALGADVTVVDISRSNAQYAEELAQAAGVQIRYVVSDVLALPESERMGAYDLVFMELGILHYFVDLRPLFGVVNQLLCRGGRLVLQDFHPVSTKLITSKGKKHKVTGNYFDTAIEETSIAYIKYLNDVEQKAQATVQLRKWTLGEIVTAVADADLHIEALREEPNTKSDDAGIPKTFTLASVKL